MLALFASMSAAAYAEPHIVREINLVPCDPIAIPDGTRVLELFAPEKNDCSNSARTVLIRIAEYGKINALCSYRGGGKACTQLHSMNTQERAHFEHLRAFATPAEHYGTCTAGDGSTWLTEMVTPHGDCKPEIHAVRHWDFIQGRVYLKEGAKGIGAIDLE